MKPWKMGPEFLRKCKNGVLNYVLARAAARHPLPAGARDAAAARAAQVRPCTALIAFIAESQGVYGEGDLWNPSQARRPAEAAAARARSRA